MASLENSNHACMICGSRDLHTFIDLGNQPNGNNFPLADAPVEPLLSMSMQVCKSCWLVQISEFPSAEFLFTDHPYITGVNVPIVRHFEWLAARIVAQHHLQPAQLAVDIGCNDGTLLSNFARHGLRVLGVDPGRRTNELCRKNGINVVEGFWNEDLAKTLVRLGLIPDVITATAVFYHVGDLHDFVRGLEKIMHAGTVAVIQCVYMLDVIERNQFDHFYHEHSCIHALGPLVPLFREHGLRVVHFDRIDVHGGSFLMSIVRDEHKIPTDDSVQRTLELEHRMKLDELGTYVEFAKRVAHNRETLRSLLAELKHTGKKVVALGAPAKGSTLLNYCGIGPELVDCAIEVNKFKIGRSTPGTRIPIIDEAALSFVPDYFLVLSWNFLDYFLGKYKSYLLSGGKFIVPVPQVRVLGFESAKG